jgi:hypothetical protein
MRIVVPMKDEVIGGWRKLHSEEVRNLFSLPNIMRMITSRRMRLSAHVACMGRRGIHIGCWWEKQKARDYKEDLYLGGRIILKWILEKYEVVWTGVIWLRIGISGGL